MKIMLRQTGGYAGISSDIAVVEIGRLDLQISRKIEQIVRELRFFELPPFLGSIGADLVRYEMTISDGEKNHTVVFDETDDPRIQSLLTLVNLTTQIG